VKRAVVLLSGGIDSSTVLAIAGSERSEIYALSFDYRQRHRVEIEYAKKMAAAMKVRRHLIVNFDLREIGGSALTADIQVPQAKGGTQPGGAEIPVTYVPARNTIFLSFGLAWAEVLAADAIYIGANAVDYSGYPDCRPEYLHAFENMANLGTKASVEGKMKFEVRAPLISMRKSEIIAKGTELGVDYSLSWSCYDPQARDGAVLGSEGASAVIPCGHCDSCRIRAKGFEEAGIEDPLTKSGSMRL
jgi:7-cyano-7-deazaguanine synthase